MTGTSDLIALGRRQARRNRRYCLRAYRAGPDTQEDMQPAPYIVEEAVICLQVAGVVPYHWATTARIKSYIKGGKSGALSPHVEPWFYQTGPNGRPGHLVHYTLSSLAVFSVETPAGIWEHFACGPQTAISVPARLSHYLTEPLTGDVRFLLVVGHDLAMMRSACDFHVPPGHTHAVCHMGHLHKAA